MSDTTQGPQAQVHTPPAGTTKQRLTVHLDILDAKGQPDSAAPREAFTLEVVQIGVGLPPKVEPTPFPARGPLVLKIDRAPTETSHNFLYIRGPGHLGLPQVRNWASNAALRPVGDAEIRLTLQDGPDMDYPAVPPGWVNPRVSEPPDATPEVLPAAAAAPVVQGRLDLRGVRVEVSVRRKDGTPVTDYLCQIRQHDGALPLTQVEEVGAGRSFRIRASSVTTYVWLWQAGNQAKTFQRKVLRPGANGPTESVVLEVENTPVVLPHRIPMAPSIIATDGASIRPEVHFFPNWSDAGTLKHARWAQDIRAFGQALAHDWIAANHLNPQDLRILFRDHRQSITFTISDHGGYHQNANADLWAPGTDQHGTRIRHGVFVDEILIESAV
ncbi:MAG: hypothetical protein H6899_09860 [Rhodobacter sp.]|nr:hypothetical protein [Paracoccaceae bacterium]MCC0080233.1 hypothetical protein [Rhodobacter sp.]